MGYLMPSEAENEFLGIIIERSHVINLTTNSESKTDFLVIPSTKYQKFIAFTHERLPKHCGTGHTCNAFHANLYV